MTDEARRAAIIEAVEDIGHGDGGWATAAHVAVLARCSVNSATQYMRTLTTEGELTAEPPLRITKMGSTQRQFRIADKRRGE